MIYGIYMEQCIKNRKQHKWSYGSPWSNQLRVGIDLDRICDICGLHQGLTTVPRDPYANYALKNFRIDTEHYND